MDIETGFLLAVVFIRKIYIGPSREADSAGVLYRLELPAYGIKGAGGHWYLASDFELKEDIGLIGSRLDFTLYHSQDINKITEFIPVGQVDD